MDQKLERCERLVFAHVNYDYTQLAFLGWIWLDAESVNRLHEKPVQPRL